MFWAVDDLQSCTDPLQSRSSIVSLLLFSPFSLQVLIILAYVKMGFKVVHPQLIDNTRFKPTAFWNYGNSCNLQWLRSSGSFLSLKVWAWVGLKWSESEPRSRHRQHHCILNTRWNKRFWSDLVHGQSTWGRGTASYMVTVTAVLWRSLSWFSPLRATHWHHFNFRIVVHTGITWQYAAAGLLTVAGV